MNTKINNSFHASTRRLLAAGLVAMTILAGRVQGQFVSTAITNGLNEPYGVTTDPANNVYLTDSVNNRVVKYTPGAGTIVNLAGLSGVQNFGTNNGIGTAARFNQPQGIVYSPGRGGLVVADQNNQELRFVSLGGAVSNLAGVAGTFGTNEGPALGGALLSSPTGLALDADGVTVYIADKGNNEIRMLTTNNMISNVVTGGYRFNAPSGIAVDNNDNLWVADSLNQVIVLISNGVTTVMAGTPRVIGTNDSLTATSAQFNLPTGIVWDAQHSLFAITDTRNNTIRGLYLTNVLGVVGYTVQTIGGFAGVRGFVDGALGVAEFNQPEGICIDAIDSGYYVIDTGNNAMRVLQATQPPPPPQAIANPVIGYVSFPLVNGTPSAQFNPFTAPISVFNNAVTLAIEQFDPTVQTYLSSGPTGSVIAPPTTNSAHVQAYNTGDNGLSTFPSLPVAIVPSLTLETISEAPGRPSSSAVSAQVQFVTANPNIIGNNAANIVLSNVTAGAQMYYTLDGSIPTNNGGNGVGPFTSGQILTLDITSNVTFSVIAFAPNFAPSGVVSIPLNVSNFVGNQLTFGFSGGIASTKFVTAPGRTFYAPVTLSELPGTTIYSMQFDLVESATNFPVTTNSWRFDSMLVYPSTNQGFLLQIPPDISITNGNPTNYVTTNTGFVTTNNLLELGWITIPQQTNLYPTTTQDLTAMSLVHGYEFQEASGSAVMGAFSFAVPLVNSVGNTYTIQAIDASASTFTSITPSQPVGVYIQTPTNGSLGFGTVNALKQVTVTNSVSYLVGDAYPFSWFNAGDFGDSSLLNDDVLEVYQTAIGTPPVGGINGPPPNSDYFDAMDSSDGSFNNLYSANDAAINGITTGDGLLMVDDVYVTFRRSLDTNLTWWIRSWSSSGLTTTPFTNFGPFSAAHAIISSGETPPAPGNPVYVSVAADQVQSGGNSTVQVPVRLSAVNTNYPLRVMMLNVEIDPLDGSPPITSPINFSTGAGFGSPTLTSSQGANNYGAAWLDSTVSGVSGSNIIGTVTVTLPSNATSNSAYRVHFDHFSGSPNGLALFHTTVQDGLITVGDRTTSSWKDGIPDTWRLLWFGTVSNMMSAANADPDSDGASNWAEYVAGTNPNDPASVFQFSPGSTFAPSSFSLQWPSVVNKHYSVQTCYRLNPPTWITIATNIVGTGQPIQWTDTTASGKIQFYRATVQ